MTSDLIADRYRLLKLLGEGGMGRVWLADDQLRRCHVALKQIRADARMDRAELRERALREARALRKVNHPSMVRINRHFVVDDDPWIDMEYIEGDKLLDIINSRLDQPLSERRIAEIALPIVRALRVVHEAGVLHRDVKPNNILVPRGDGLSCLVDFGIAKIDGDSPVTQDGRMIGTPEYMAPERLRKKQKDHAEPGPPSDLWSVGVTLFCALEGYSPFDAGMGTVHAVLNEPPPAPTRRGKLAAIVLKLLEKDPSNRPTVAELDKVLQEILDGGKGSGHSPEPPTRPDPPPRIEPGARRRDGRRQEAAFVEVQLQRKRDAIRRSSRQEDQLAMLLSMSRGNAASVLAGLRPREAGAHVEAIAAHQPQAAVEILRILSSTNAGRAVDFMNAPAAASVFVRMRPIEAAQILNRTDPKNAAQIVMELSRRISVSFVGAMQIRQAASVLSRIWPATVAAMFRDSDELKRKLLDQLDPAFRVEVIRHL